MTIEITILISVISVSAAIFFGFKSTRRADTADIEERAKKNAEINLKLDNILATVSSMKDEMKELTSRLTKDEKDTEMLIVRFSELEKRIERLEEK